MTTTDREKVLRVLIAALRSAAELRDVMATLEATVVECGIADEARDAEAEMRTTLGRLVSAAQCNGFAADELGLGILGEYDTRYDSHLHVEDWAEPGWAPPYAKAEEGGAP